jgi:hypothetical protein
LAQQAIVPSPGAGSELGAVQRLERFLNEARQRRRMRRQRERALRVRHRHQSVCFCLRTCARLDARIATVALRASVSVSVSKVNDPAGLATPNRFSTPLLSFPMAFLPWAPAHA